MADASQGFDPFEALTERLGRDVGRHGHLVPVRPLLEGVYQQRMKTDR